MKSLLRLFFLTGALPAILWANDEPMSAPDAPTMDTVQEREMPMAKIREEFKPFLSTGGPSFYSFVSMYSTRDRRTSLETNKKSPVRFNIRHDFPRDAPEIVCIIADGGSGRYLERIVFLQRQKKYPGEWRKIAHFDIADSMMPWPSGYANVHTVTLTPDSILISVGILGKRGQTCGSILCRFRLKDGIYRTRDILISEVLPEK